MGGIGLRLWELAQTLADAGIEVTVVAPAGCDLSWPGVHPRPWCESTWRSVVESTDAVVTTDLPDPRVLLHAHAAGRLLVTENAVPIEHLEYQRVRAASDPDAAYAGLRAGYLLQTWVTDHFLVRSPVERATTVAVLAATGRLCYALYRGGCTLPDLISMLPVGFTRAAEVRARAARPSVEPTELVWSGGIWDYFDTGSLLQALALLHQAGRTPRVRFCYPPPTGQRLGEAERLTRLRDDLALTDQVLIHPPGLAHSARDGVVNASRVLVALARPGVENDTCHRLRLRDALLYRLPVLIDAHGASGAWVRQAGLGIAVDTATPAAVAEAIDRLLTDTARYAACRERLERASAEHRYQTTVAGLMRFLQRGRRAADAGVRAQTQAVAALLAAHPTLREPPTYPI
jgi:hypothetical protein